MKSTRDGLNPFCSSRLKRRDGTCGAIIAVRETSDWRFCMRTACRSIPAGEFFPVLSSLTGFFSGRFFPLFIWEKNTSSKERNLQKVLDAIRMKFGKEIIAWGKNHEKIRRAG